MRYRAGSRRDAIWAMIFGLLTLAFVMLMALSPAFFRWAFERHHNVLSWYVRPLFLIPFCFFSYRRSWAGVMGTLFALLTSMFWFPAPDAVGDSVREFLAMEMEWLTGTWTAPKILLSLLVPASLFVLGLAFWKRNLWFGLTVVVLIAVAKFTWSVVFGGEAGWSILAPAAVGLAVCLGLIYAGFRRMERSGGR